MGWWHAHRGTRRVAKSATSSIGFTSVPFRKGGPILAVRRTRPARIFEQSCRGLGNATWSRCFLDFPSQGRIGVLPAGITSPRPRSTPSTSQRTRMKRPRGWGQPIPVGAILAGCACRVLQLRVRYGNGVEVRSIPRTDPLAACDVGTRVPGPRSQTTLSLGVDLLPKGQDGKDILPAHESHGSCPHQKHNAGHARSGLARLSRRRCPPERAIRYPVRSRGDQAEDECRDRREEALASQGSTQDVCHLLRRTCSGIVDRDPWPFGRRRDLPPLCASCSAGFQGNHDAAATFSIRGRGQRVRWPVSMLSKAVCRRLIASTGTTYGLVCDAVVNTSAG